MTLHSFPHVDFSATPTRDLYGCVRAALRAAEREDAYPWLDEIERRHKDSMTTTQELLDELKRVIGEGRRAADEAMRAFESAGKLL